MNRTALQQTIAGITFLVLLIPSHANSSDSREGMRVLTDFQERNIKYINTPRGATASRLLSSTVNLITRFNSGSSAFGVWAPLEHIPDSNTQPIPGNYLEQLTELVTTQINALNQQGKHDAAEAHVAKLCWTILLIRARVSPNPIELSKYKDSYVRAMVSIVGKIFELQKDLQAPEFKISKLQQALSDPDAVFGQLVESVNWQPHVTHNYISVDAMNTIALWSIDEWRAYIPVARSRFPESSVYHAVIDSSLLDEIIGFGGNPWYPMGIGEFMDSLKPYMARIKAKE